MASPASKVNPVQRGFGTLAGLRLTPAISIPGRWLAAARGGLQLFASTLTGTGLASFVLFIVAGNQALQWSWTVWLVCVAITVIFDAFFNIVLNIVAGVAYVVLFLTRLALTLLVAQFTGQMLLLQVNQEQVLIRAATLATSEFENSLSPLRKSISDAQSELSKKLEAQSKFVSELGTKELAGLPATCGQRRTRGVSARNCAAMAKLMEMEAEQRLKANERTVALLEADIGKAQTLLNGHIAALDTAEMSRTATVTTLAHGLPKMTAALGHFMEENAWLRGIFWALLGLILLVEGIALMIKALTSNIDEAALAAQAELGEAREMHQIEIEASRLMQKVGDKASRSTSVTESARHLREQNLQDAMATRQAVHSTNRVTRKLQAALWAS